LMARLRVADLNAMTRSFLAILISFTLLSSPLWATPSASLGTVVFSDRARVGSAVATVGATIFSGDHLTTDSSGSIQIRAGAARFLLSGQSSAIFSRDEANPSATLLGGSATFSTANSHAFAVHFSSAVIRPSTDQPTIGNITILGAKELVVKCTRGSLSIAVDDDVREIPEGSAYRIVLDPNADPQGPRGAGAPGMGGPPIKAAKSKFIWYAIAITAVITFFAVREAWESDDRP